MAEIKSEPNIKVKDCRENLLPHLESLERMMKLPVVEAAIVQGQGVYGKVKGIYYIFFIICFKILLIEVKVNHKFSVLVMLINKTAYNSHTLILPHGVIFKLMIKVQIDNYYYYP